MIPFSSNQVNNEVLLLRYYFYVENTIHALSVFVFKLTENQIFEIPASLKALWRYIGQMYT